VTVVGIPAATRLGLVVFGLSLVIAPALALWPLSLVPSGEPFRIGVVLFAGLTGLSMFAAGAFTLSLTCFIALRPVLWHSRFVAARWTRWGG
jgi:hypothetical protein